MQVKIPATLIPIFQGAARYRAAYGGRGSGKSVTFAKMLLLRGLEKRRKLLCGREFQNSIKDSVHAEALAAAAHFPDWVQAMDGERVPYVWMPGYQVTFPGYEAWRYLPYLYWYSVSREVELGADWDGYRSCSWACPVVVRRES